MCVYPGGLFSLRLFLYQIMKYQNKFVICLNASECMMLVISFIFCFMQASNALTLFFTDIKTLLKQNARQVICYITYSIT